MRWGGLGHPGRQCREKGRGCHLHASFQKKLPESLHASPNLMAHGRPRYAEVASDCLVCSALKEVRNDDPALLLGQVLDGFVHQRLNIVPIILQGLGEGFGKTLLAPATSELGLEEGDRLRPQPVGPRLQAARC